MKKSYHFENVNEFSFQLSIELFNSVSMQKCFTSAYEGDKRNKNKNNFWKRERVGVIEREKDNTVRHIYIFIVVMKEFMYHR